MTPTQLTEAVGRTHLDLFAGIGGFSLACRWNGVKTIAYSEIEPYACRVFEKNFPGVPNLGDITRADFKPYTGRVWLLTGGFPCQPFSLAGKRRGASDDRHLWPAMLNVIRTVRPAWVLGENVLGIISMVLADVLTDLETAGYQCQTFVIPACATGINQLRNRIWIVAHDTNSICLRWEGERVQEGWSWSRKQFERLVQDQLRVSVPTGRSGGVSTRLPHRVDRLKGLGNAIVPQIAAEIIRCMIETENCYEPI